MTITSIETRTLRHPDQAQLSALFDQGFTLCSTAMHPEPGRMIGIYDGFVSVAFDDRPYPTPIRCDAVTTIYRPGGSHE